MKIWKLLSIAFLAVSSTASAMTFDGVWQGKLQQEGQEPVDLHIYMTLVEDVGSSNTIDHTKILGSFVVDREGGPYSFSEVTFELETGKIDLKYRRPQQSTISGIPSDYRFIGKFVSLDRIEGNAISGRNGPHGTFFLVKSTASHLVRAPHWHGNWKGDVHYTSGATSPFEVSLKSTASHKVNPESMDLDYTHGKMGFVRFGDGQPYGLTHVYIDYVTGQVELVHVTPSQNSTMTLRGKLDRASGIIRGDIESSFGGQVGQFELSTR